MRFGGIDLGGTKIEARLFEGPAATTLDTRRIATPLASFEALMDALNAQLAWLEARGGAGLPVGLSVPGVVDPETGAVFAVNIPSHGRALGAELAARAGRPVEAVVNDCMAFAVSEARGGAASGTALSVGLVIGTGMGGGVCLGGALPPRHAGLALEIGHTGVHAATLARHGLPLLPCACGRTACLECYVPGPALTQLATQILGEAVAPADLPAHPGGERVLTVWADITADALDTIHMTLDPDVIVLGGGVSNLPSITGRLTDALAARRFGNARQPPIRKAHHGDSSGARGAALIAALEC